MSETRHVTESGYVLKGKYTFRQPWGAEATSRWKRTERQRFWQRVSIGGINECWWWQGHKRADGYGIFKGFSGRKDRRAHRYSYEQFVGPITNGLHVLHRCDNPPCVNPKHLFLGTQADNTRDMHNKGRDRRYFEKNRKLTSEQVQEILMSVESGSVLGRKFGVSASTIIRVRLQGGLRSLSR